MLTCENCGLEIDSFRHYCPNCGKDLWKIEEDDWEEAKEPKAKAKGKNNP